ncbi:ABC transporter permease [Epidermidibacterium keratini]
MRPPLHTYIAQLWERRHFIKMQAWANAMSQHRGTFLGNLWLIAAPLLDGLMYYAIFGIIFAGNRDVPNFFGFLIIGIFIFTFTARSVTSATRSIPSDKGLIRGFRFPRAALPLAAVWRELIAVLPVLYVLIILLLVVPPKASLGFTWLLLPFILLLQVIFNLGLGFIGARIGAQLPDFQQLIPYLVRAALYGSAVLFAVDRFDNHPPLGEIVRNNPLYLILDMNRSVLLYDDVPPLDSWLKLAAWAVGCLVFGLIFFWRAEVKYARTVLD